MKKERDICRIGAWDIVTFLIVLKRRKLKNETQKIYQYCIGTCTMCNTNFATNDFESGNYDEINDSLLSKIAEFLGVSVEYFKDGVLPENLGRITLNETERLVVVKYRANPQYRDAIHQLLGITADDACTSDHGHRYKTLTSSDIDSSAPRARIAQSAKGVYHTEKKED